MANAILVLFAAVATALAAGAGDAPFPAISAPRAITSGPHEHLLANYFAINAWSGDLRYVAVLETDVNGRLANAGERCTLGLAVLRARAALRRPTRRRKSTPSSARRLPSSSARKRRKQSASSTAAR